jgi:N-acetylneuraminic acid mutarotase
MYLKRFRFHAILLLYTVFAHFSFSQNKWEKIPQKFKGFEVDIPNFGSETNPAPRSEMVFWNDKANSKLWLYGGQGKGEDKEIGLLNDLWVFDIEGNNWTAIDPTKRNESKNKLDEDASWPQARRNAMKWTDSDGNLWLYGGTSNSEFNHFEDLWKFDIKKNQWQLIDGKGKFNVGPKASKQKTEDPQNIIGSRAGAITWTDNKDNLWIFGGNANNSAGEFNDIELHNDLWKFNTKNKKWSWISGLIEPQKKNKKNDRGKFDSNIAPSPRSMSSGWFDSVNNKMYIYGGVGIDSTGNIGGLSDMWVFDIQKEQWNKPNETRNSINSEAKFATLDTYDKQNNPGYRINANYWNQNGDELYMMGGQNKFSPRVVEIERFVWAYNTKLNQWKIVLGLESVVTSSGSTFMDRNNNLYLFGGVEYDEKKGYTNPSNKVWKLNKIK